MRKEAADKGEDLILVLQTRVGEVGAFVAVVVNKKRHLLVCTVGEGIARVISQNVAI